jgi:hypothetical protein
MSCICKGDGHNFTISGEVAEEESSIVECPSVRCISTIASASNCVHNNVIDHKDQLIASSARESIVEGD